MKILETFAGVGSQRMALERPALNKTINDDSTISEWYTEAIVAYWRIHHNARKVNNNPTDFEMIDQFNRLSLSKDSKTPHLFTPSDINRRREFYVDLYNANIVARNFGSISNIDNWEDRENLGGIDLLTYSFPCQDLSTAGNMRGLNADAGTRSSLLWQVLHLIRTINNDELEMPKVLLMENVSAITSNRYAEGFDDFREALDRMGYVSFGIHLNASAVGARQNRNRYFHISIREDLHTPDMNSEDFLESILENHNQRNAEARTLRQIVGGINHLEPSTRNNVYEAQLQEILNNNNLNTTMKMQHIDNAYPTFNQAKVVIGLDFEVTPTVTFQGEFSKIRVFDIQNGNVIVRRLGPRQNWELMGFTAAHYNRLNNHVRQSVIASLAGNSITTYQLVNIFAELDNRGIWNEGNNE